MKYQTLLIAPLAALVLMACSQQTQHESAAAADHAGDAAASAATAGRKADAAVNAAAKQR